LPALAALAALLIVSASTCALVARSGRSRRSVEMDAAAAGSLCAQTTSETQW